MHRRRTPAPPVRRRWPASPRSASPRSCRRPAGRSASAVPGAQLAQGGLDLRVLQHLFQLAVGNAQLFEHARSGSGRTSGPAPTASRAGVGRPAMPQLRQRQATGWCGGCCGAACASRVEKPGTMVATRAPSVANRLACAQCRRVQRPLKGCDSVVVRARRRVPRALSGCRGVRCRGANPPYGHYPGVTHARRGTVSCELTCVNH